MNASREKDLIDIADLFLDARRTGTSVDQVDPAIAPQSLEEAYFVQDRMAEALGEIGGWKIGAVSPEDEPFFAPMPLIGIAPNGSIFRGINHRLRGLEAEISFQMGANLPPRNESYTREEVVAAIAGAHPAIEILECGVTDPAVVPRFVSFADMQMHGGFVYGPSIPDWQSIDWAQENVILSVDGSIRVQRTASNPAGTDLLRLMVYLANEGASRTRGLRRGQWVTTGSWTGATWATANSAATAHFTHSQKVSLHFE